MGTALFGAGVVAPLSETRICMSYPDRGTGTHLCLEIGFDAEECPRLYGAGLCPRLYWRRVMSPKSAGLTKAGDIAHAFKERFLIDIILFSEWCEQNAVYSNLRHHTT